MNNTAACRVLVVDDERNILITAREFLRDASYQVCIAENVQEAHALLEDGNFDVVVSDVILPGATGVDLMKTIRDASSGVQVVMMTGEPTVETASEAVRAGASDYLAKPVDKQDLLRAVGRAAETKRVLDENRMLLEENRSYQQNLERMVQQRTAELHRALEETIRAMALAVELRDPYTAGHQQRVAELARAISTEMGWNKEDRRILYYAGLVHDLGKSVCLPKSWHLQPNSAMRRWG